MIDLHDLRLDVPMPRGLNLSDTDLTTWLNIYRTFVLSGYCIAE
jgi:hypothetical protein